MDKVGGVTRTDDTTYGAEYWDSMDGGKGCRDSLLWSDMAFIVHHLFAQRPGEDLAGEFPHVDVGCGYGYLVKHMRGRGFESFGLDFSKYALSQAPKEIRSELRWFDLSWVDDSAFGRERFRLVTSFETLEHIPAEYTGRALGHIWNLLTPGGIALLNICVTGQPGWDTDPTHYNVASRDWWEGILSGWDWDPDEQALKRLAEYQLFSTYKGTFVMRKP